jgi:hypothetical protein
MPHDDPKIARLRAALDAAPHDAPAAPAIAICIVVTIQKNGPDLQKAPRHDAFHASNRSF